jgi:two-component system LytT family sensor kinase
MNKRFSTVGTHLLIWVLFLSLPAFFLPRPELIQSGLDPKHHYFPAFIALMGYFNITTVAFFYLNYLWIMPRFWLKGKRLTTLLMWLVALVLIPGIPMLGRVFVLPLIAPEMPKAFVELFNSVGNMVSIIIFFLITAVSTGLRLSMAYQESERRRVESENARLDAELAELRTQMNPHFLFNTLNGIYALTSAKSDRAPEAVMLLSNLLRYVLSEAKSDFVPLSRDIEQLRTFIKLSEMRLTEPSPVHFELLGMVQDDRKIAPLMLQPFIENAFKYGISLREASPIIIRITVQENLLEFYCKNKIVRKSPTAGEPTGIGINNTKRRLDLLYPERHTLHISETDGNFEVNLQLNLNPTNV